MTPGVHSANAPTPLPPPPADAGASWTEMRALILHRLNTVDVGVASVHQRLDTVDKTLIDLRDWITEGRTSSRVYLAMVAGIGGIIGTVIASLLVVWLTQ